MKINAEKCQQNQSHKQGGALDAQAPPPPPPAKTTYVFQWTLGCRAGFGTPFLSDMNY